MARLLWTDMKFNNFNHCLQNGKQKNISEHTDIWTRWATVAKTTSYYMPQLSAKNRKQAAGHAGVF